MKKKNFIVCTVSYPLVAASPMKNGFNALNVCFWHIKSAQGSLLYFLNVKIVTQWMTQSRLSSGKIFYFYIVKISYYYVIKVTS